MAHHQVGDITNLIGVSQQHCAELGGRSQRQKVATTLQETRNGGQFNIVIRVNDTSMFVH